MRVYPSIWGFILSATNEAYLACGDSNWFFSFAKKPLVVDYGLFFPCKPFNPFIEVQWGEKKKNAVIQLNKISIRWTIISDEHWKPSRKCSMIHWVQNFLKKSSLKKCCSTVWAAGWFGDAREQGSWGIPRLKWLKHAGVASLAPCGMCGSLVQTGPHMSCLG